MRLHLTDGWAGGAERGQLGRTGGCRVAARGQRETDARASSFLKTRAGAGAQRGMPEMAPSTGSAPELRKATRGSALVHRFRLAGPRARGRSAAAAMAGFRRDPSRPNRGLRATISTTKGIRRTRRSRRDGVQGLGSGGGLNRRGKGEVGTCARGHGHRQLVLVEYGRGGVRVVYSWCTANLRGCGEVGRGWPGLATSPSPLLRAASMVSEWTRVGARQWRPGGLALAH